MICKTCNFPNKWHDGRPTSRQPVTLTDGPKYEHMLTQPLKDLTAAVMELAKIIQNQTK